MPFSVSLSTQIFASLLDVLGRKIEAASPFVADLFSLNPRGIQKASSYFHPKEIPVSLFVFLLLSDMQWPTAGTVGHMHAYGGGEGRTVLDCGQACKHLSGDIRPHTSKATPSQRAQLTESHIGPGCSDKLMRSFSFLCKPHLSTLWVFRCLLDEDNT